MADYDFLTYEGLELDDYTPFNYDQAGFHAQPEVQMAIQRFRYTVPEEVKEDVPLLYWLLGSGTQPYKQGQEDSEYVDRSRVRGQQCYNCVYAFKNMTTKKLICSQIRGHILAGGWCRLWEGA